MFYAFLVKIGKNNGGKIRGTWVIGGYKYGPIQTRAQMRGMVTLTRTDARTNEGELGPGYREGVGGARLPVLTLVASSFSLQPCVCASSSLWTRAPCLPLFPWLHDCAPANLFGFGASVCSAN